MAAGTGAAPAALYLGLCRLRGILSLPAFAVAAAGGQFFFAATKIRIGRGRSSPPRPQQVKPFFFDATKIRIGRGAAPPQRPQQTKLFFIAATKIRIGRGALLRQGRLQQAKPFSPASIPKSGPEIKNRCTKDGVNGQNPASIPKSSPEIKNRCTNQPIFSTHPQHIPQPIPQHAFHRA